MTVSRERGKTWVDCDGAGCLEASPEVPNPEFLDLLEQLETDGWTKELVADRVWNHYCPNCSEPKRLGKPR